MHIDTVVPSNKRTYLYLLLNNRFVALDMAHHLRQYNLLEIERAHEHIYYDVGFYPWILAMQLFKIESMQSSCDNQLFIFIIANDAKIHVCTVRYPQ